MYTVVITGAGGFIGSHLVRHFRRKGWAVTALTRQEFDLSRHPNDKFLAGADYLVHCAFIKNSFADNVEGTRRLLEVSRKCGIRKNIFLSSISAREDAVSVYGRQKVAAESLFTGGNDWIIRAGLVIGNGGLFKEMLEFVRERSLVPLIHGGRQPLQTIHINDLALAIETGIERNVSGVTALAESDPPTYKEFYAALCQTFGIKARFIPLPYFFVNSILAVSDSIGIKLPVTRENLRGLRLLDAVETRQDLEKIGITVHSFSESLKKVKADMTLNVS